MAHEVLRVQEILDPKHVDNAHPSLSNLGRSVAWCRKNSSTNKIFKKKKHDFCHFKIAPFSFKIAHLCYNAQVGLPWYCYLKSIKSVKNIRKFFFAKMPKFTTYMYTQKNYFWGREQCSCNKIAVKKILLGGENAPLVSQHRPAQGLLRLSGKEHL